MTDVNSDPPPAGPSEETLRLDMELLFYAYRDFTGDPDAILARYGFGRAHHRVIYFVGRNPDITVSELLRILRITKQSLSRVLGQLVRQAFVVQRPGERDRRQRLLRLTARGERLERALAAPQWARIAAACRAAGPDAVAGYRAVLLAMIDEADRRALVDRAHRGGEPE
jgi:DNA-binding MarR family transcriptional regulator